MKHLILILFLSSVNFSLFSQEQQTELKGDQVTMKKRAVGFSDITLEENFELFSIDLNADGQLVFRRNGTQSDSLIVFGDDERKLQIEGFLNINSNQNDALNIASNGGTDGTGPLMRLNQTNGTNQATIGLIPEDAANSYRTKSLEIRMPDAGRINFFNSDDVTTADNMKITILSDGKVGIGTATPTEILDVKGSTLLDGISVLNGNSNLNGNFDINGANHSINFRSNTDGNHAIRWYGGDDLFDGLMVFESLKDQVKITNSGVEAGLVVDFSNNFVGIGTETPTAELDVNGKIALSQSSGSEMVIINNNSYNHAAGDQNFGDGENYFIMASKEGVSDGGGIYGDGDIVTIWSPGDGNSTASGGLLAVLDDDAFNSGDTDPYNNGALKWYLTASGGWIASDVNRKKNIKAFSNCLDKISALDVHTYNYRLAPKEVAKGQVNPEVVGIIAQDLKKVIPQAVNVTESGEHFVNYNQVTPVIIGAVKELSESNKALKAENELLLDRLSRLEAAVEALTKE